MKRTLVIIGILVMLCMFGVFSSSDAATATTQSGIAYITPYTGWNVHAKTITASTSGSTEVVAAVTGKSICVVSYDLVVGKGDVNIKFMSAANDIDGSPLWKFTDNGGVTKPVATLNNQPVFYLCTNSGEALNINLSASVTVSGAVLYVTK